jgi:hypothetical protein
MSFIDTEASAKRFWFGLFIAAALGLVSAMVAANFEPTGPVTDAVSMVGP